MKDHDPNANAARIVRENNQRAAGMKRFTLRDLFWLILVVAMAVGWWVDRSALVRKAEELYDLGSSLQLELQLERGTRSFEYSLSPDD